MELHTGNMMVREEPEPGNKLQGMRDDLPGGENNNGAAYRVKQKGASGHDWMHFWPAFPSVPVRQNFWKQTRHC
ncbi:hypothetical protein ILYODFUR_010168 [Ilyodon furcidens]|uniref:Uncharacterized protein n=1 Tax=Ilyodon furcidens TaxID=33524 RepID=A0ABV0UTG0_9TELE